MKSTRESVCGVRKSPMFMSSSSSGMGQARMC